MNDALSKAQFLFKKSDQGAHVESGWAKDASYIAEVAQAEALAVIANELVLIRQLLAALIARLPEANR